MVEDERFDALRTEAETRGLTLDMSSLLVRDFESGERAVIVPLRGDETFDVGHIMGSESVFALSLGYFDDDGERNILGMYAEFDNDGTVNVRTEDVPTAEEETHEHSDGGVQRSALWGESTWCQYVDWYYVSIACIEDGNPFGYYYYNIYRYGITEDPMYPNWFSCYQSQIHVCPQYEHPDSPFTWIECGFPPSHPAG
jgi:hypothetical protein